MYSDPVFLDSFLSDVKDANQKSRNIDISAYK